MPIHVGILGGGGISDTHARAAREIEGVEIAAVAGENPAKVKELADRYHATAYEGTAELLRHRPLELVLIGSPPGRHAEQGIAAARQGLHVMVEKPIDVTLERADELIAACEDAGVKLGVFFQGRFAPDLERLKRAVDDGALGRPFLAAARVKWWRPPEYYSHSRWRGTLALEGGGALLSQGIHTLDLLLWLLGDVSRVWARAATALHRIEVEDTLVATLEFESGALATLEASTAAFPGYPRVLELTGSEGTVVIEQDRLLRVDLRRPWPGLLSSGEGSKDESASSPLIGDVRGHRAVLEDFLRAIREGGEPRCSGREGRRSQALVDALYRSARGDVVNLPEGGGRELA
ncbi:MAG TPA: Gfo/Idh/MocA family oxidoreductase [Vicinamibacteria bacterium]|jgi:UDP-N-acetyl-2-amino-2-deoxyglucuronate dehydrogenase|nr:Gfo/Idh/MocA family oxidoreductase [Vicinamibacteria bacterium]